MDFVLLENVTRTTTVPEEVSGSFHHDRKWPLESWYLHVRLTARADTLQLSIQHDGRGVRGYYTHPMHLTVPTFFDHPPGAQTYEVSLVANLPTPLCRREYVVVMYQDSMIPRHGDDFPTRFINEKGEMIEEDICIPPPGRGYAPMHFDSTTASRRLVDEGYMRHPVQKWMSGWKPFVPFHELDCHRIEQKAMDRARSGRRGRGEAWDPVEIYEPEPGPPRKRRAIRK